MRSNFAAARAAAAAALLLAAARADPGAAEAMAHAHHSAAQARKSVNTGAHEGHHHPETEGEALLVFVILMGCMVALQLALFVWNKRHKTSFMAVTLAGLWLFPPAVAVAVGDCWRFLFVWFCYSCFAGHLCFLATRKPVHQTTPRRVYSWFFISHKVTYGMGVAGYALLLFNLSGLPIVFGLGDSVAEFSTKLLLFYGLYFGVLGRDSADLCAGAICTTLGYAKAKGDDDAAEAGTFTEHMCALCGVELRRAAEGGDETAEGERLFTIDICGHVFHEFCIRGWSLVGKKDSCPRCCEKVDLKAIVGPSTLQKQSLLWLNLLDALRYMVVWNPVILLLTRFVLYEAGLGD